MLFNSFNFVGFYLIVLLILFIEGLLTRSVRKRNLTLLIASYLFYGLFNIGFLAILVFVSIVNYIAGFIILRKRRKDAKIGITITIVLSLLPLIFFKYSLFLCNSLYALLSIEFNTTFVENLLLPVGISFFTFQALSYTIDLYRGKVEQCPSGIDFFLFVSFFPTILSGPIEKARELLPQIKVYTPLTGLSIVQGSYIFIWGLFKKVVIADRLADYVDLTYLLHDSVSGMSLAVAAAFYSIQIYCDFSGYSDMALGVAKGIGFDVTKNFKQPYFSRTFKDFWRKWHISLTSWFTEYVYFTLGGSRVSARWKWMRNISLVFLLSGIWHGAAWSFLIWGALHAIYYLCEHYLGLQRSDLRWNKFNSTLSCIMVFILVTIAWIFFRVTDFDTALSIINKIFTDWSGDFYAGMSTFTFVASISMLGVFLVYELLIRNRFICFDTKNYHAVITRTLFSVIPLLLLIAMFGKSSDSFVYFKF